MKKKLLFLLLTAIAFLSFVNTSFAQRAVANGGGVCYATLGTNDPMAGSLIMIDIATGAGTVVGDIGFGPIPSLAINSAGQLFCTDIGNPANLYSIDPATGVGTLIGSTGLFFPDALAFDANDVLYTMDSNNDLYTLDPATGASTLVVSVTATIRGMEFDPTTNILWGGEGGGPGTNDGIFTVDLATGTATLVGNTGLGSNTPGICFDAAGNLYGSMGGGGGPNSFVSIDKGTGVGTVIGPIGFIAVAGMSSPVHITSVEDQAAVPTEYQLAQNYPNPFNPSTTIRYSIPTQSSISLKIYNINGQLIATLVNEVKALGNFNAEWNGNNELGFQVASGVYIYRIVARAEDGSYNFIDSKKLLLLK